MEMIGIILVIVAVLIYIAFELGRDYQRFLDQNNIMRLIRKIESEKKR